ncbi:interferon-related developmental regulator 2-like [Pollicipes pollicipes]|uniref:interferon-related developmental regulator 2-like n=1 Tax=Pollicipes pollicipes TaxID=41117 RepID=UPI001884B0E7|nr:interferon-related developmental regulator 2-like [Pollicipes pollicipes]
MPKGIRKKAGGKSGRGRMGELEEEHSDTISVTSSTDERSVCDGSICGDQEVDDSSQAELFEEKVGLALDGALDKSVTTRTNSLLALCTAFSKKYVPDIVESRRMTLCDAVEKCLKKGKSAEVAAAADLAVLVSLQLRDPASVELVYAELRHTLATLAADNTAPAAARAKCCLALAVICYLGGTEPSELHANMALLETVFGAARPRDGAALATPAEPLPLHTAALQAWTLLVADVSHNALLKVADSQLPCLTALLDSPDVELRIAAGEAIVAVYETLWSVDDTYVGDDLDQLCAKLKQLATDSAKSRTKRDRKQQRCSFRDILRTFEEDEYPNDQVKFGKEVLLIDTWSKKHLYDFLASVLRSGTNAHLKENELVRAALGLGAPLVTGGSQLPRISKLDRMYQLNEATKCRQQARGKFRDKRTAIFD